MKIRRNNRFNRRLSGKQPEPPASIHRMTVFWRSATSRMPEQATGFYKFRTAQESGFTAVWVTRKELEVAADAGAASVTPAIPVGRLTDGWFIKSETGFRKQRRKQAYSELTKSSIRSKLWIEFFTAFSSEVLLIPIADCNAPHGSSGINFNRNQFFRCAVNVHPAFDKIIVVCL